MKKPPTYVTCHHCGANTRPRWTKRHELPPGITMMGFSACNKCQHPALHINGDPDAVAEVTAMFEESMGWSQPDARLTDMATGKPKLDG